MIRLTGFLAVLLIGGLPVLMLPDVRMLEGSAVVWIVCAAALLLPSLGLAVLGSVAALLMFSVALLIAASGSVIEAMLMGIAILTLLDITYFEQRFGAADGKLHVAADHLSQMAVFVVLSVLGAVMIVLLASVLSQDIDATSRSFIAAFGAILVFGAMVWKAGR